MLVWRGWGVWVFFLFLIWMFAFFGVVIGLGLHGPDPRKDTLMLQWGVAGALLFYAASIYALDRYRKSRPVCTRDPRIQLMVETPHVDHFYYIRMEYWVYVMVAAAVVVACLTAAGVAFLP
ncbi:MAG TPA: hypothetical protein VN437_06060 [Rectinemataceae bacterium]|nr:hypothetical protein [Rectinemataceae bacterium]